MKRPIKILIASLVPIIMYQVALASSDTDKASDYSVVALKDCQVVSNKTMTTEQFLSYTHLKQQDQIMQRLQVPIQKIEQEIEAYTDEIEKLTKLAIQETDETLHINKTLLKQQDSAAQKFNEFMQLHQQHFDALGEQGNIIGQRADIFETSIKANLKNIDYDQIQVLTPSSQKILSNCDNDIQVMIM
jgi:hypothetical protein